MGDEGFSTDTLSLLVPEFRISKELHALVSDRMAG